MQMQDWRQRVGANVKQLRLAKGLTQEAVAHEARIDLTYLGGIERGRRNPSLDVMVRVARAVGAQLPDLLVDPDLAREQS